SPISSSPVLIGKLVVIGVEKGIIYALDTDNNEVGPQLSDMEEKVYGSLSGTDGVVYIHTEKDGLYAVDVQSGAKREFYIN
ncbi:PQQ-binding-like beta-propeller repeat protein, partial [Chloroflexota bacterium]